MKYLQKRSLLCDDRKEIEDEYRCRSFYKCDGTELKAFTYGVFYILLWYDSENIIRMEVLQKHSRDTKQCSHFFSPLSTSAEWSSA